MAADHAADSLLVRLEDPQQRVDTMRSTLEAADELGPLVGQAKAFAGAARPGRFERADGGTLLIRAWREGQRWDPPWRRTAAAKSPQRRLY